MNYDKWLSHEFSSGPYAGEDYIKFQSEMKRDLRKQLAENDLVLHSFGKNHYEFSAVALNPENGRFGYISISDVRFFKNEWFSDVLYRTMKTDKDWTGGPNRRCKWENVGSCMKQLLD